MNYYERHLGDYAKDTAHLTMLEHGAYSLLLDRYYATEKPIPAAKAYKMARASSKDERAAVDSVLGEFFDLEDGCWHQKRCDEHIATFQAKPSADDKRAGDRERQRRARERRKQLFEQLRQVGVVAPWDATTEQLQDTLIRATSPVMSRPVTCDNTAIHTPDTSTKDLRGPVVETSNSVDDDEKPIPAADSIHLRAVELTAMLRKQGAALQASDPRVREWAGSGVTDAQALTAIETANQLRAEQGSTQPINAGYLDSIIKTKSTPQLSRGKATQDDVRAYNQSVVDELLSGGA